VTFASGPRPGDNRHTAPLRNQSNTVLGVVFGMAVVTKDSALPAGMISALFDELSIRGLMPDVLAVLGPDRSTAVKLRVGADRGRARRARGR
jgi:hypothetical protein